jgi:hypothetical protein
MIRNQDFGLVDFYQAGQKQSLVFCVPRHNNLPG